MNLGIPCTDFLMFSASSVAEGTGFGTEMEAMEAGPEAAAVVSPSRGIAESEKWRKRKLRGGMLWMHSRQQHQQHMTHDYGAKSSSTWQELCLICLSDMSDDFALIHFKFHSFRFQCGSHFNYNWSTVFGPV